MMVVTLIECSTCKARSRGACECDWKVRIEPSTVFAWARYKATAEVGTFLAKRQLLAYGLTVRGTEKRIRRVIRRQEKKWARVANVKELTIKKGEA